MSYKLFIILFSIFLSGCSAALRDRNLVAESGENWEISNGHATYQCGNSELEVGSIGISRLILSGPVIPVIPFTHEYPGHLTVTVNNASVCPTINSNNMLFSPYKTNRVHSTISCEYKLGELDHKSKITLQINSEELGCTAGNLQFKPSTSWGYCLVCSA